MSSISSYLPFRSSPIVVLSALALLAAGAARADPPKNQVVREQAARATVAHPPASHVVRRDEAIYDLWTVGCTYLSGSTKTKNCTARLPVKRRGSQQLLVVLAVGPNGRGEMRFQATVPTSTMVQPGVSVRFEPGGVLELPILSCDPDACLASVPYSEAIAARIAGAVKVAVRWTNIASGLVETGFSVKGARNALAALSR
jgi:invasion protein IalB